MQLPELFLREVSHRSSVSAFIIEFSLLNFLLTNNSAIMLQFHHLSLLSKIPGLPGLVFLPPFCFE